MSTQTLYLGPALSSSRKEIYVFDCETLRILEASEGLQSNLGYKLEDLRELTLLDFSPDLTRETFERLIHPIKEGEQESIVFETMHQRADETLYPVDVHVEVLGRDCSALVAIVRDATERQRDLQRRERRISYLTAMDRINAAIVKSEDVPTLLSYAAQELLDLLDCDRVQIANLRLAGSTISVDYEAHKLSYSWGQEVGVEVPVDETLIDFFQRVLNSPSPIAIAPGEILSVLGQSTCELLNLRSAMAYKICPRLGQHWMIGFHQCSKAREWSDLDQLFVRDVCHRLEEAIRALLLQQEASDTDLLYRAFFEQARDGVVMIEASSGDILQFNDQVPQYLGYSREEFAKLRISDIDLYHDDRDVVRRCSRISEFGTEVFETRHICKDGAICDVEVRATPVTVKGRSLVFSVWCDISARKQAEVERETRLWFLQAMEDINRALTSELELETMLSDVLDTLLDVLCCDRVSLLQLPHPDAEFVELAFQSCREGADSSATLIEPVKFSAGLKKLTDSTRNASCLLEYDKTELQKLLVDDYGCPDLPIRSVVLNPVRPRESLPWYLSVEKCSQNRAWREFEKDLIVEVSHRLEDTLTALQSLKQLEHSQSALQLAQQRAKLGNWELVVDGKNSWWSPQMYEIYGINPALGPPSLDDFFQLIHPEDREKFLAYHSSLMEDDAREMEIEFRTNPSSGPVQHLHTISKKERSRRGTVLSGTCQDITRRKLSELALQESEQQLRLFIEHAPAALAMLDRNMCYLSASRRWKMDYGLGEREVRGLSHYELFPEVPERWKEVHQRALQGEVIKAKTDRFERADGSVQWLHWEVHPWRTCEDEVGGVLFFTEDLTELVNLNQQLESKVEQRTAELKASNRKLDEFAHTVSHDLRAPLRAMEGFAKALQEDYGDLLQGDGQAYLENIVASASRMDVLIFDLLRYSRLSRDELEMGEIEGEKLFSEVKQLLEAEVTVKRAIIELAQPLPKFYGNLSTLVQLFTNLLSNAMKFVDTEERPCVKVWHEELADGRVRVYVEDNGIGIAPEFHDRIFQPFQRLHGIESYPGTGIGLAIVSRACERHGGRCGVASQLGQGSHFWVELPTKELRE